MACDVARRRYGPIDNTLAKRLLSDDTHQATVALLLRCKELDPNMMIDEDLIPLKRYTALSYAVFNGAPTIVKILIGNGANVNVPNTLPSPLTNAAIAPGRNMSSKIRAEIVDILLSNGATGGADMAYTLISLMPQTFHNIELIESLEVVFKHGIRIITYGIYDKHSNNRELVDLIRKYH